MMKKDKNAISISKLQPEGNFKEVLVLIEECDKNKKYNSSLSELLKMVFVIIESIEEDIQTDNIWNIEEAKKCGLYAHLIAIDLNSTAHRYLNGISPDPKIIQLQDWLNNGKNKIYGSPKLCN